ncbi:MAG: heme exporter protein CcmB [bacterium]
MSGSAHSSPRGARPGLWQEVGWIVGRDLLRERRTLGVVTMSVLLVSGVVAACALVGGELGRDELACAAIWVSIAFAGVYSASNAYAREQSSGVLQVLLCGPLRGVSLFLGKAVVVLLVTFLGALAATGLSALLIHSQGLLSWPGRVLLLVAAGCFGFSVVGALVAPLLGLGAGREALLSLVLLPLGVPIIVAGARGTAALFSAPAALDVYVDSLGIVLGLDALFLALALWLFDPLVRRAG